MSIVFAIFLLGICLPLTYPRQVEFFRKDYTYIEQFDAFYKVHRGVSGSAWSTALLTCDDEGAVLFYPKVEGEWTLVKNLTDKIAELPNVQEIFVGLHDEFKLGEFITVDGYPTPSTVPADTSLLPQTNHENCMTMNVNTGLFKVSTCFRTSETALSFVCKKADDESCPTIDRGYKYAKASKKCYKVNENKVMWQEAMKTCFLEGGILAVVEDSAQAHDIRSMIASGQYFVGVRRLDYGGEFYTVKGQKFNEMYQNPYQPGQSSPCDCGTVLRYENNLHTSYKYAKASKKCYKVNENKVMWQEAMKTCFLEGGILAVIEDSAQAHDIRSMIASGQYFVGVRRLDYGGEFYTVKGQKFNEMYQNPYQPGQSSPYDCGTVLRYENNLHTSTFSCVERAPFVCELNV